MLKKIPFLTAISYQTEQSSILALSLSISSTTLFHYFHITFPLLCSSTTKDARNLHSSVINMRSEHPSQTVTIKVGKVGIVAILPGLLMAVDGEKEVKRRGEEAAGGLVGRMGV